MDEEQLPGSLDQRSPTSFRVRVVLPTGEKLTQHFPSLESAQSFRRGLKAELSRVEVVPAVSHTLTTFVPKWLEARESLSSHKNDVSIWRRHLSKAPFANIPLASISRNQVKEWVETLRRTRARAPNAWKKAEEYTAPLTDRCLSKSTIAHAVKLLRCVLETAKEDGHLRENPALAIKLPKKRTTEEEWTFLRFDEMQQILLSPAVTIDEKELLLFAWHTGLHNATPFLALPRPGHSIAAAFRNSRSTESGARPSASTSTLFVVTNARLDHWLGALRWTGCVSRGLPRRPGYRYSSTSAELSQVCSNCEVQGCL